MPRKKGANFNTENIKEKLLKSSCACNYEDGKIMNGQMDCSGEFIIVLIWLETIGRILLTFK